MKRFFLIFIVLLFFSANSVCFGEFGEKADKTVVEIVKDYESIVVNIQVETKNFEDWQGSGFFIDEKGYILTNAHVVLSEEDWDKDLKKTRTDYRYWVIFKNKKIKAQLIGINKYIDAAVLKINSYNIDFKCAPLGDSDKVQVGQEVIAIGSALGLNGTTTLGIVSALHRRTDVNLWQIEDFIQTDVSLNPGNSGSPLINRRGEVIGVNDAKIVMAEGIGFAIPINLIKKSLEKMKNGLEIVMGYSGMEYLEENFPRSGGFEDLKFLNKILNIDSLDDLIKLSALTEKNSALVTKIEEDSPAYKAGLQVGDIIVEFNGQPIFDGYDLNIAILEAPIDKSLNIKVIRVRYGQEKSLDLKINLIKK